MNKQTSYQMGKVEWIMLIALSMLWGSSFINLKNALTEIEPFTLVFLRASIAAIGLMIWCLIRKKDMHLPLRSHVILFVLGLVLTAIPFSFFTFGQKYISTSMAAIFNGSVPFFTAVFAHFLLGQSERLSPNKVIGLAIGLLGIFTMIGYDALNDFDLTNFGQLAIICACFFYAVSGIYTRLLVPLDIDNTLVATYSLIWAAIVMAGISYYFDGMPTLDYAPSVWFSITTLGLLSTALTYIILFRLIKRAGASNTALTTFIIPIFAIAIGVVFLGESLSTNEIYGVILILIGLSFIQNIHKLFKQKK